MGIFKDFVPEGEKKGAVGSGFRDWIPDNTEEKKITSINPQTYKNEEKEKVEFDDSDLEDLGIDKQKLEEYKKSLENI